MNPVPSLPAEAPAYRRGTEVLSPTRPTGLHRWEMVERGVEAEMRAELTLDEKLATRRALTVDARLRFGADVLPAFGPISEESERNRERRLIAEAERAAMRLFFARIARNVRSVRKCKGEK
jgi:hypothetical protein